MTLTSARVAEYESEMLITKDFFEDEYLGIVVGWIATGSSTSCATAAASEGPPRRVTIASARSPDASMTAIGLLRHRRYETPIAEAKYRVSEGTQRDSKKNQRVPESKV